MRVSQFPSILPFVLTILTGSCVLAQERCDVPSPSIYCNSTEILAYHSDDCKPFHVFITRGSDEPYPGRLGNLTSEICAAIGGSKDCGYEDVEYPAKSTAWGPDMWCGSASKGAKSGQAQMKAYSKKCPDSKLIVLGFSQGGSVAQDMLGGGGGAVFACEQDMNPALDATSAPGSNVVAAVTFGAVVRSRDQNFTVGRGVNYDGTSARSPEHLKGLKAYADVLLDYCHYGDPICAVGSMPQDVNEHLNYFVQHNEEVIKWVAGMAKASGDVSAKPSKPVIGTSSSSTSIAARPQATPSGSATPSPIATTTDDAAKTAQTSATGAASSLTATLGYMTALALTVVVFL
ncbi:acetylxylan esterase [Alternaria panax]|uniref:Acetylxylan esterase n=1 Tax=Alternaria panax TaxID=48097 RepID=A0AAD4I359_9PLEO|nr:acetylxylan esterase [Alternaria panax]